MARQKILAKQFHSPATADIVKKRFEQRFISIYDELLRLILFCKTLSAVQMRWLPPTARSSSLNIKSTKWSWLGLFLHPRTRTNHKRRRLQSANNKPVLSWENYIIQTLAPFGAISFCKQHSGWYIQTLLNSPSRVRCCYPFSGTMMLPLRLFNQLTH